MILAIDPGKEKAGYAALDTDGRVLAAGIAPLASLRDEVARLTAGFEIAALAVGTGTNARAVVRLLDDLGLPVHEVDEFETTRRARELYFADHPPRGWRRLIPLGLQVPPRAVDDYAAILIGRRFLTKGAEGTTSKLKHPR